MLFLIHKDVMIDLQLMSTVYLKMALSPTPDSKTEISILYALRKKILWIPNYVLLCYFWMFFVVAILRSRVTLTSWIIYHIATAKPGKTGMKQRGVQQSLVQSQLKRYKTKDKYFDVQWTLQISASWITNGYFLDFTSKR